MGTTTTATPMQRKAFAMLTENTGTHFLDSGGAYGRQWERNAAYSLDDWCATPRAILTGEAPYTWRSPNGGETQYVPARFDVTLSTFHYLCEWCDVLPESDPLHAIMARVESENPDESWYDVAGLFADTVTEYGGVATDGWNTYNHENLLSQVLQGFTVQLDGAAPVLCVQVHGGCDVRGGYTRPHLLALDGSQHTDADYAEGCFLAGMTDADVYCTNPDCAWGFSVHGMDIITRDGDYDPDYARGYSPETNPTGVKWDTLTCPECGTVDSLRADMMDGGCY